MNKGFSCTRGIMNLVENHSSCKAQAFWSEYFYMSVKYFLSAFCQYKQVQDWDWITGSEPLFTSSEKHRVVKRIQGLIQAYCVNQSEHRILTNENLCCIELLANGRGSCAAGWFGQKERANLSSLCHSPLDRAHVVEVLKKKKNPTSSPSPPFKVYLRLCHCCCGLNPHICLL